MPSMHWAHLAPAHTLRCSFLLASLLGASPWAAAQLLKPLPGTQLQVQQLAKPSQDPAPVAVQVSGTPTTAVVSWTAPPQSVTQGSLTPPPGTTVALAQTIKPSGAPLQTPAVLVERLMPNAAPIRLALATPDATQARDPGPLTPGRAVTYRVTLTNAQGASGAREASFTPPPPRDPAAVSATVTADGSVILSWQEVPGVLSYQITGVALPAPVIVNRATEWRSIRLPPGPRQWKVASVYEPGGVLTAASAWTAVMSQSMPTSTRPFLSMPNGAGSLDESAAAYDAQCASSKSAAGPNATCLDVKSFLSLSSNWRQSYDSLYNVQYGSGDFIAPTWPSVAFADLHDLGVGRRVNCTPIGNAVSRGTLCWATSHGLPAAPGQPTSGSALASAGEQGVDIKSLNVIVTSAQGAFFGTWEYLPGRLLNFPNGAFARESAFVDASYKRYLTPLDSQGQKSVPTACLSCHGGRYDPSRKLVVGASLLPLVPAQLSFSSPQARMQSEEDIRRINHLILESNPAPAVRAQISALYNGTPTVARTPANDAAVPPAWAMQPGLYRQVIAPYCGSCHFAQTGPLHFGSFANLMDNKQRIQKAVCTDFTMPHSEVSFRRFWSGGGAVSLPGLLSTVLGFTACPQ